MGQMEYEPQTSDPFSPQKQSFEVLEGKQVDSTMKDIYVRCFPSVISYKDSLTDSVKIGVKIEMKDQWMVFSTPLFQLPSKVELVNIDKFGKPELVVESAIASEYWATGYKKLETYLIYQIDSIPLQILRLDFRCNEMCIGSKGKGAYDITIERTIFVREGNVEIKK